MKKMFHLYKKTIKTDSSGFTLIEMAVVLVIVGIIVSIMATVLPSLIKSSKVKKARAILEQVDYAIQGYVAANGRLPFADKGTSGKEDSQTPTYFGNLPYVTLGLSSGDDAWGNRLKYGVNKDLTATNPGNIGTALKTACSGDPVNPDKLHVNINGTLTHMAYVIVSGGLKDEDGVRGLFDGLNRVDDAIYDNPNRIIESGAYDDLMDSKACTVLAGSQGFGLGSGSGNEGSSETSEVCDNGTDDDGDGHIDCDDQDCYNISPCGSGKGNVSITTSSLPSGYVNSSYSATFQATGGTTPYEWTLSGDGGFSNLFLHTYLGQLSGTLGQCPGTYTISAQVKDSDTENDPDPNPSNFTIQVKSNMSVSRTSGSGVDIEWGSVTQQETFQANGGHLGDIQWTLDTGGASGFTVASSGSDTCTIKKNGISSIGSFTFTLTATDASCADNAAQIILSVSVLSTGGGAPYSVGLAAEWRMDECSWDGTDGEVLDSGSSSLNGKAIGGANTIGSGKVCSSASFTAANHGIEIPDDSSLDLTGSNWSVAFWYKMMEDSSGGWDQIFIKGNGSRRNYAMWLHPSSGRIHFRVDPGNQGLDSNSLLTPGAWYFITGVYDSGTLKLYLNGALDKSATGITMDASSDNDDPLYLGKSAQYNTIQSKIDEFMVFSKALTEEEITSLYTLTHTCSGTCYTESLAVYYMDESSWNVGTAGEVKDSSGNSYHGTPYGSAAINTTDSHIGYSGEFTSSLGYIDITGLPVSTSSGDQTTVTFWMKWLGGNSEMPIGWTSYDLWFSGDRFGFNTGQGDIYGITGASAKLANNWHHIAAIFTNSGTVQNSLFIDGVEQSLSTVQGSSHGNRTVGSNFRISGWMNSSGYRFNGLMDELRIYKRGLSANEIADDKDLTH
ncbi:MAG: LamG domain-containing protein [Proteobacteria bacterium]|nr:LamG domain-containing protein [Pseudomonadota bacterium]